MPEPMGALNPHQPCEITGSSWDVGTAYCVAHDRGEIECLLEAAQREVEELRAQNERLATAAMIAKGYLDAAKQTRLELEMALAPQAALARADKGA